VICGIIVRHVVGFIPIHARLSIFYQLKIKIMLEKEFVKYNEALALKELGLDEPCLAWYNPNQLIYAIEIGYVKNSEKWIYKNQCSAPTYSQTFKWFRDKHNLYQIINVFVWDYDKKQMAFSVLTYTNPLDATSKKSSDSKVYGTYEEAELECLKKLIEIVKNK
jgi:hypothetical protein